MTVQCYDAMTPEWHSYYVLYKSKSQSLGACNYPIFLSRRFHRPIYFQYEFISNLDPQRNLSDQLQSQAWANVDLSTRCRLVHRRPLCFIFPKRVRVDWNWPILILWGKYLKIDWSVKMPLHWLIMGVAARLLVLGS